MKASDRQYREMRKRVAKGLRERTKPTPDDGAQRIRRQYRAARAKKAAELYPQSMMKLAS